MSVSVSFGGACRKTTTSTTTTAATTLFHFTVAHSHSGSHWLVQSLVPNDKQMALISALLSTEQQQQTMKNCPNCHNSFLLFHLFLPLSLFPFSSIHHTHAHAQPLWSTSGRRWPMWNCPITWWRWSLRSLTITVKAAAFLIILFCCFLLFFNWNCFVFLPPSFP